MKQKELKKLKRALILWLQKNDMHTDVTFYEIEEWRKRGEIFHNESEMVLISEAGFGDILNGHHGDEMYDEFCELVEQFGFYLELGHSWNGGFYEIEDHDFERKKERSYKEVLRDDRWKEKREKVLQRAENKCEECGTHERLEVHHTFYKYGYEPWQYPLDSLKCLCRKCHEERGEFENIFRAKLAVLTLKEMKALENIIEKGMYWYPKNMVVDFLNSFGYNHKEMNQKFSLMIKNKNKQEY
ncbi:MAG: hypothetical protein R2828_31360 [Saprospiraceae bacterium]